MAMALRFASETTVSAPCLTPSNSVTLIDTNRTSGFWKIDCDAVAKSVSRVPTWMTTSASLTLAVTWRSSR